MVKPADLAGRADFQVGSLSVSPSRRRVEGPAGTATVEPLIMQVFLLLLDAAGKVVTRDELFDHCWGGDIVGDDSLNRAIARVRRIGEQAAPGLFEIETIPRTGYRLTGEILASGPQNLGASRQHSRIGMSRRVMVGSAAALGLAAAGGVGLWSIRARDDQRFNDLMDRGEQALDYGDPSSNPTQTFRRAVAMRPDNAKAQGLLAYSQAVRGEYAEPGGIGTALQQSERAARAALALDPGEPDARLAQVLLQRSTLDFAATEDRLRDILAEAPDNIRVMRVLWNLLQSTGRSRDALALVERAIAIKPLAAANNYPRAQLLWILGRNAEADRVIDRAMQYWPSHRFVRFARFTIYTFTGRPDAALAMLNSDNRRPQAFAPDMVALWRVTLEAMQKRSPASIAAARKANIEGARRDPSLSSQAVLTLSTFGEIDAAFDVANDLFLFRDPVVLRQKSGSGQSPIRSTSWRFAPWLFTPPIAPLRADPRFNALCDGIGLTEYWAKRGIRPDFQLGIT